MPDSETLRHTTWNGKYHVGFIPTYRRKALYSSTAAASRGRLSRVSRAHGRAAAGGRLRLGQGPA